MNLVSPAVKGVSAQSSATQPLETVTNTLGMKFTLIPAGEFIMGSADDDKDADADEKPRHRVRDYQIPFYLGVTEVTPRSVPPVRRDAKPRTGPRRRGMPDGANGWNEDAKKLESNAKLHSG